MHAPVEQYAKHVAALSSHRVYILSNRHIYICTSPAAYSVDVVHFPYRGLAQGPGPHGVNDRRENGRQVSSHLAHYRVKGRAECSIQLQSDIVSRFAANDGKA